MNVLRAVKSNLHRAILCPRFLLAVAIGLLIQYMGMWDVIAMPDTNVVYLYFWMIYLGTFQLLLVCVPAMVCSDAFLEDTRDGYLRLAVQRSGLRAYLWAKTIAAALAGFLVMVLSSALFILLLRIGRPVDEYSDILNVADIVEGSYAQLVYDRKSWLYLLMNVLQQGISGAFYACMALACSAFIDNIFVVIASPILLAQWSGLIRNLLGNTYSLVDLQFGTTENIGLAAATIDVRVTFVPLTLLCGILFFVRGRRKAYDLL